MAEQDNIRVVREAFDAWNAHDVERQLKLVDENHIVESDTIPQPTRGREGLRQFMQTYFVAFPDLHFDLDQVLGSGDFVTARWTATGTHRGDLMGVVATGRSTTTHGCTVFEIRNGKQVRLWTYWDTGHLLRQLGVLPAA